MAGQETLCQLVSNVVDFFEQQQKMTNIVRRLSGNVVVFTTVAVIAFLVWEQPRNLISVIGFVFFLFILLISSAHPDKVNWRPVFGGLALLFFFAVLILKWDVGQAIFEFLGNKFQTFLETLNIKFRFGEKYKEHHLAMVGHVLTEIVFFSCAISVLHYIGVMHAVFGKIAWVMLVSLGISAPESLSAAGNIFIGQTETMIRPFLALMTWSELHVVLTCGFATIGGEYLAAFIPLGVSAKHLLCASVIKAPCALAVSKLLYPETETSKFGKASHLGTKEKKEGNILKAAAGGAWSSIELVIKYVFIMIAFLAMLEFVNAVLSWFGGFVGYPEFSFQMICSYVLMPLAYLMGVDWDDCGKVGELIGIKIFVNEFLAYGELSTYLHNRKFCTGRILSVRSEIIATYALNGFSNLSSTWIQLGALGPLAPSRREDLSTIKYTALLGGIVTSFLTACLAGLLVAEPMTQIACLNSTVVNTTMTSSLTFVSRIIDQHDSG